MAIDWDGAWAWKFRDTVTGALTGDDPEQDDDDEEDDGEEGESRREEYGLDRNRLEFVDDDKGLIGSGGVSGVVEVTSSDLG